MPTLLPNQEVSREQLKGYTIFVWAHDHPFPPHVHFRKGKQHSAWDLRTQLCIQKGGFSSSQLREQRTILAEHLDALWRSWHAHWRRQAEQ
jgi:hypothetical protein